nr:xylulose kinase-1 [Tanacetum cinerariifolium]
MSKPMTSQSAFSFPDPTSFSTQQETFTSFSPGQTYNTSEPVTNSQPNPQTSNNFQNQQFKQYHTATLLSNNAKFLYLKKEEYETWLIKMEYWIMNTDHNLWKIIQNGNSKKSIGMGSKGGIIILPPVSFKEHSLPEDHMTNFHHLDDAKEIWLAVKARFGGNEESKKMRKTMHEAENKTEEGEQVYGLMAGFKSDFTDHAGNAAGSVSDDAAEFAMMGISSKAKIKKKEWEVKLVESLASDKSSKLETSDFVSCVSRPKTNDSSSTIDVKILSKSNVKDPRPTNGIPSCSFNENVKPSRNLCNKSGIADMIHCKNNFVCTKTCFVCGSKTHLIKDYDVYDNVPSVVLKAASALAGSRNSSASISACRSIPAASGNRAASIHASKHIPAGRFNWPAPFLAGRSVPTGWTNHAARPFFRPINLYFDNVSWPRIYDHMSMNEGR